MIVEIDVVSLTFHKQTLKLVEHMAESNSFGKFQRQRTPLRVKIVCKQQRTTLSRWLGSPDSETVLREGTRGRVCVRERGADRRTAGYEERFIYVLMRSTEPAGQARDARTSGPRTCTKRKLQHVRPFWLWSPATLTRRSCVSRLIPFAGRVSGSVAAPSGDRQRGAWWTYRLVASLDRKHNLRNT